MNARELQRFCRYCWCAFIALGASAAVADADREQGLPIVNTILPIRYNTPASPVGPGGG